MDWLRRAVNAGQIVAYFRVSCERTEFGKERLVSGPAEATAHAKLLGMTDTEVGQATSADTITCACQSALKKPRGRGSRLAHMRGSSQYG